MRYAQHRSSMRKNGGGSSTKVWMAIFGVLITAVVVLVVMLIGKGDSDPVEAVGASTIDETPSEVMEAVVAEDDQPVRFEEINIYHNDTELVAGFARRGTEQGAFVHVAVAEIPAIDPAIHYYEGWLVKPGITEYFSTGALFPREDGKFGLIFEIPMEDAPEGVFDYSRVVITRELFDDDPSPSPAHIAEGEFN